MPAVRLAQQLTRHCPAPERCAAVGSTVAELLADLNRQFPGLAAYVVDERGALRQHVHIFIGEQMVRDRAQLSDPLDPQAEVWILQALSGG